MSHCSARTGGSEDDQIPVTMAQRTTQLSEVLREDYLSCKICYELYRTPKLLPCLHTYCEQCLGQLVIEGSLNCPECRIKVPVKDGVKNLKSNFFINSLLELLQPKQTKDLVCSVCATAKKHLTAVSRCLDCHDFLCQSCSLGHGCSRATVSHRVVDLEMFLNGQHDSEVRSRQEMFCLDHSQEPLRFFCDTCNAPICRDCRLLGHFQHHVISMADAIKKKKPEVNQLIEGLGSNISKIIRWKEEVTESLGILSRTTETIKTSIISYIDEVTALLQSQKEAAFKELDNIIEQETAAILVVRGELDSQLDRAVSSREFSQKMMDFGSDSEIMSLEEMMRESIQELQSFTPQKQKLRIPDLVLSGKEILPQIKFFRLEISTKDSETQPDSTALTSMGSLPVGKASTAPTFQTYQASGTQHERPPPEDHVILQLLWSFDVEQDDDDYKPKITGLAAFPGAGGILLADQDNDEIKRFSMNGDLRRTITLNDSDLSPCSIAVCGNTLACSANNYLLFMTLGGSFLHKLKLRSNQDDPQYAIASYSSQYIAVSEGTLCSVSLYNTKGECLERIKPRGYQGIKFLFIAINQNEEFIVCDVAKQEIVIFNRCGDISHIMNSSNSPFARPFSLCLNSSNDIFVVDDGRVIQFSENGMDGKVVLNTAPGESRPRMIVIDSSGRLVLVAKDNSVRYYEFI